MKKIFITLLSLSIFSLAYAEDAKTPVEATKADEVKGVQLYDFSSEEAMQKSIAEQCEKAGVDVLDFMIAYIVIGESMYTEEDIAKIEALGDEVSTTEFLKNIVANRSPAEMIAAAKKIEGKDFEKRKKEFSDGLGQVLEECLKSLDDSDGFGQVLAERLKSLEDEYEAKKDK